MDKFLLRIRKIIPRPGDTVSLELEPVGRLFPRYEAGQFLTLVFHFGERELRRSYSFYSSPHLNEPLAITVKRVENGEISRFLHHKTSVGDVLTALTPQGQFTYLPEPETRRTIFLFAAGVGITPLFSILKTALVAENRSRMVLVYSNRSEEATLFLEELKAWEAAYPERLTIIWIFSNSKNLMKARLNRFYLEEIVRGHLAPENGPALFYTCGPVVYMDLCRITLLSMGFDASRIKRETFVLPEDEADDDDETEKTIDTNTYDVTILLGDQTYRLEVPYQESILDSALKRRIPLPYSCSSGMCSTCIATCIAGKVRMDYNEVLTDRDLEAGKVLVCTGHPAAPGTVISYL